MTATTRAADRGKSLFRVLLSVTGLVICPALILECGYANEEARLDGDPFRGRMLFESKQCVNCHSVWGHGGATGPDITRVVAGKPLYQLTGEFWNHTPRMIDEVRDSGYSWPSIDREEMADILSYLYYLRLFDAPGEAVGGAATYARLRCGDCHSLAGEGDSAGGPLDRFSAYPSSVQLAQAMWNAGPAMQEAQMASGRRIPEFSGTEMADLQVHIRERGFREDRSIELLPLPDPARGAVAFRRHRCHSCHDSSISSAPELGTAALRLSVAEISGILWNHSYAMHDQMRESGISFPIFRDTEMADIISYLHFRGFVSERGDPERGKRVFADKRCVACHEGAAGPGPDLTGSAISADAVALSAAMWNHAPQMHELMADHAAAWPQFEPGDMEDLAAFLRALGRTRGTNGP